MADGRGRDASTRAGLRRVMSGTGKGPARVGHRIGVRVDLHRSACVVPVAAGGRFHCALLRACFVPASAGLLGRPKNKGFIGGPIPRAPLIEVSGSWTDGRCGRTGHPAPGHRGRRQLAAGGLNPTAKLREPAPPRAEDSAQVTGDFELPVLVCPGHSRGESANGVARGLVQDGNRLQSLGIVSTNTAPRGSLRRTSRRPPCALAIWRTSVRPIPDPPALW